MSIECEKMGGINMSQGVCDTPVPASLQKAVSKGIKQGFNIYTRYDGIKELRRAIAQNLKKYNRINADPESEIIVSAGSTGSFYCACLALLDPGDEVILFEPYYGYHVNTLEAVEAKPAYVSMKPPHWTFSKDSLERAVNSRTKGIMINTPANPSGKIFSVRELKMIGEVAKKHDLWIFTDEIYEHFVYGNEKHVSPMSIPELRDRTIMISGYSKTFSITGWRIGYSVSAPDVAQMIGFMNDLVYVCAPSPLQFGVAEGLKHLPQKYYSNIAKEYQKKRDFFCSTLSKVGLEPYVPAGAYYVLANVAHLPGRTSKEKAMYLLRKSGVATVPGEAFFHNQTNGKNMVRFCFAKEWKDLRRAANQLRKFF